jgi:hypothetical protein
VLSVLLTKPDLPASPVPGGHGGATLIRHSLNVVAVMREMLPHWQYVGHRNAKGEVVFPLLNVALGAHRFSPADPLALLTAFAHDIGKVVCYEQRNGGVVEVRKHHDTEGAKLLRAMPEVMKLPWPDRSALLLAVEYYHKPMALPEATWIDDRTRSLMELLIAADQETGRREEAGSIAAPPPVTESVADDVALPVTPVVQVPPPVSDVASSPSPYDLTYSILIEGNRVNGTNTSKRIAWKHGEWLYINDARLRAAVAERTGDSGYMQLSRGQMHAFTLELLDHLASGGHLLQEHEGARYSPKRAIWTTRLNVPGKLDVETKFVIVTKVAAFPLLANVSDCKSPPVIVKCSWGDVAAIDKKGDSAASATDSVSETPVGEILPDGETGSDDALADDGGGQDGGGMEDLVQRLRNATDRKELPYLVREIDGVKYRIIEEDVAISFENRDWSALVKAGLLLGVKGGSGKNYYGLKVEA